MSGETGKNQVRVIPIRPVKGAAFGVRFVKRGPDDPHVCLQLLAEDDGNWQPSHNDGFSSFWLPDLIAALQQAEQELKRKAVKSRDGFGWRFRGARGT